MTANTTDRWVSGSGCFEEWAKTVEHRRRRSTSRSAARDRAELVTDDKAALRGELEAVTVERIAALEAAEPEHAKRREAIERYIEDVVLESFPILEYDWKATDWQARERARLATAGRTPSFVDGQIAAVAYTNGLILVTSNTRDVRCFKELKVQSWL